MNYSILKHITLFMLMTVSLLQPAAQYKPVDKSSSVKFTIKNLGINVNGQFSGLEGNIAYDPDKPSNTMFAVTVNAATVNTGNDLRDSHLCKSSYFDVEHYPHISFQSTNVSSKATGSLQVAGKLTIKNHTKDISFPCTVQPTNSGFLFKGKFTINRKDFEVGGASIISDNADVSLEVVIEK